MKRPPIAEWVAATLGLLVTTGVIGHTIWEGITSDAGPPQLSVVAEPTVATGGGFVVPIIVRNASHATAADVEVRARSAGAGPQVEERRARFSYVPGQGEVRGGLVFKTRPQAVELSVEGYAEP